MVTAEPQPMEYSASALPKTILHHAYPRHYPMRAESNSDSWVTLSARRDSTDARTNFLQLNMDRVHLYVFDQ